ncbi:MAG: hypothetical protein NTV31_01940 [Bacteroidia bacterium]|nr:hypothetical protein [Bacteroidia bacterium]
MDVLEVVELKDQILNYLNDPTKKRITFEVMFRDMTPRKVQSYMLKEYVEEMEKDKTVFVFIKSGNRPIISITDKGKKILQEGGYKKRLEKELEEANQKENDDQKYRDKTDLEIENLKASIKHYKSSKRISIWAIVISILTFLFSVLMYWLS